MAHIKQPLTGISQADKQNLVATIRDRIYPGAQEGTEILILSKTGTIDPLTQEITYNNAYSWLPISGIVGSVTDGDRLLDANSKTANEGGKVVIGTLKISYLYNSIENVAFNDIKNVRLLSPGVSGLYLVQGRNVDDFGGVPLFFDLALVEDRGDNRPL